MNILREYIKKKLFEYFFEDMGNLYYHGSNYKFEKFELTNNKTYKEFDIPSWFFTKDIEYAKSYGNFLYTVKLNLKNIFDTSNPEHYKLFIKQLREFGNKKKDIEKILDEQFYDGIPYWTCEDAFYTAKSNGFDSILIQEELDREVLSIAVFDSDNIDVLKIENQTKLDLKEIRMMIRQQFLEESRKSKAKSKFKKLEDNKIPLTDEERKKVMDADAVWHHGLDGAPSPAVWKSKDKKTGKITYITNTHRAYQARPTLKGAISIYHSFIKGTS